LTSTNGTSGTSATSATNCFEVVGRVVAIEPLRYTPAGIPIVRFVLLHASEQLEAGSARTVGFELGCVATESLARLTAQAPLGTTARVSGFLAPRTKAGRTLEVHVQSIHFE
jgi:primosomal replication protein N